jgi:hypothetical protein
MVFPSVSTLPIKVTAINLTNEVNMTSNEKQKICPRCNELIDSNDINCPHCGKANLGCFIPMLLMFLIPVLVFLWLIFFIAPGIDSVFWRGVIKWGSWIGAGLLFLIAILGFAPNKKEKEEQKPITLAETIAPLDQAVADGTMSADTASFLRGLVIDKAANSTAPSSPLTPSNATASAGRIDSMTIVKLIANQDYEAVARALVSLDKQSDIDYATDQENYKLTCWQIKGIGRALNEQGGEDLMRQVLNRAGELGCNTRFVEHEWNGIGTWWG